jgi:hypothetical protein
MKKASQHNQSGETLRKYWIAECQYEGKNTFWFGDVWTNAYGCTDAEAKKKLLDLWKSLFPFDPPRFIRVTGGRVYVMLDNDNKRKEIA